MKNNQVILNFIKANLGKDFNGNYNELGCAQTVNNVLKACLGYEAGGGASTAAMLPAILSNPNFKEVENVYAEAGDIILCATGTGNGNISHGHVGFLGENGVIYSNDSAKDALLQNFTSESWKNYFVIKGGYTPRYFRAIGNSLIKEVPSIAPVDNQQTITSPDKAQNESGQDFTQNTINTIDAVNAVSQDDNRPFWKSASKIVFLSFGLSATFLVYVGKITPENWMILSSAVFGYYFKNQNTKIGRASCRERVSSPV